MSRLSTAYYRIPAINTHYGTVLKKLFGLFLIFLCTCLPIKAREAESDTASFILEELEVVSRKSLDLIHNGKITFDPETLLHELRMLGEADPLNHLKLIPGIRTAGDYGSGFMIDGNLPSQVLFRIDGVPVFFPYRFGGVFSTFNGAHFGRMDFERGFHKASMPSRIGAKVDFYTKQRIAEHFSGMANVGMSASSLSLNIPIDRMVEIRLSGRISYIDQIYKPWLKGDSNIGYRFHDLNFTALWEMNTRNTVSLNAFLNEDRLQYGDINYVMDTRLSWGNRLASISWRHSAEKFGMDNRIYYSGFHNSLDVLFPRIKMSMPSRFDVIGISGNFSTEIPNRPVRIGAGYELNYYSELSGEVNTSGLFSQTGGKRKSCRSGEARLFADLDWRLSELMKLEVGVSGEVFSSADGYTPFSIDPRFSLSLWLGDHGSLAFHLGRYSQFIHQVGLSQLGLSSNFWIASNRSAPTTIAYDFEVEYTRTLSFINFSASAYYKIVRREPEYEGQLLNILDIDYDPMEWIRSYNGFNYGFNLGAECMVAGFHLVAEANYGIARRHSQETNETFRAASDPGFSMLLKGDYEINTHWEVGAAFRYASGRPYTPAKALFMIAGNLITEYGRHNSASFPAINRLDLSATWKTTTTLKSSRILEHLVNLSLLNAYGHKNAEIMSYVYNPENSNFRLKKVYSLYRFFPSISYTLKF